MFSPGLAQERKQQSQRSGVAELCLEVLRTPNRRLALKLAPPSSMNVGGSLVLLEDLNV